VASLTSVPEEIHDLPRSISHIKLAELFNTDTLQKIIEAFETKFTETYNQKFTYRPLDYTARASLFIDGDFVYTVRGEKLGHINIHLIVETKSDNPRNSDKIAVATQQKFFELIKKENSGTNIEWKLVTNVAEFSMELKKLTGDEV